MMVDCRYLPFKGIGTEQTVRFDESSLSLIGEIFAQFECDLVRHRM